MSKSATKKPGTYNGEDAACLCYCDRCGEELAGTFYRGKKAAWLAKDKATGKFSRRHVDRDGSMGLAIWHAYGAACARKVLKEGS